jgi:hypothetical protein
VRTGNKYPITLERVATSQQHTALTSSLNEAITKDFLHLDLAGGTMATGHGLDDMSKVQARRLIFCRERGYV